ncbi:MAG: hypothetical protein ACMG57_03675 [Candidatus Dojkabacteria bacterium]
METTVTNNKLRLTGIDQIKRYTETNDYSTRRPVARLHVQTLLTDDFMRANTRFWSVEEMEDEFKQQFGVDLTNSILSTEIFNKFIKDNSRFRMWRELLSKAGEINMSRVVRRAVSF